MRVQVIIPTLVGREATRDRAVEAYKAQGAEVLVVTGAPSCGAGWLAGFEQADADYLHLGADDVVPHPGALEAGIEAAANGIYPSPRLVLADGTLESCGSLGGGGCHLGECADGTPAHMSSFPIATREAWRRIGPPLPIHYYIDDYLGYMARRAGLSCEVVRDYAFTHHDEQLGRQKVIARSWNDRQIFLDAVTEQSQ